MLAIILASPLPHGSLGFFDEVLLFCLPAVIAILVLALTARRARQQEERVRARKNESSHGDTEGGEKA